MRILPVLDLMAGQVVRGVAGRRQEYRPVVSQLTQSTAPLDIARAFRDHFGFCELYLADLDAIAGQPPALTVFAALLKDGFRLWVDAGIGAHGASLDALAKAGVHSLIAGLESLPGPEVLQHLLERFSSSRLVFSLDLRNGQSLGNAESWQAAEAWDVAEHAIRLGTRRLLVLDLAGVGVHQGSMTTALCARLRQAFPTLEIATGGGIRGVDDLRLLKAAGVDVVMVASALHDGRLHRQDLAQFHDDSHAQEAASSL